MSWNNNNGGYQQGGYRGGNNNAAPKHYCGGLTKKWMQSQRGQWEKISGWVSFKQAFTEIYGEMGWQQIEGLLRSMRPVLQDAIRYGDSNGDVYMKIDFKERKRPSQSGETHSAMINTYVAQQQATQGGYGQQQSYPQPHVNQPAPPPYPPQQRQQAPAPQQGYHPTQHPAHQGPQPYAPPVYAQPNATQTFQHEQQIPGLDDTQTAGGYPASWDDVN